MPSLRGTKQSVSKTSVANKTQIARTIGSGYFFFEKKLQYFIFKHALLSAAIFLLLLLFNLCHAELVEASINNKSFDKLKMTPAKSISATIRFILPNTIQETRFPPAPILV